MMTKLATTEAGRARLAAADVRANQFLSEHMEREAAPRDRGAAPPQGEYGGEREAPPQFEPFEPTPTADAPTAADVPPFAHVEAPAGRHIQGEDAIGHDDQGENIDVDDGNVDGRDVASSEHAPTIHGL